MAERSTLGGFNDPAPVLRPSIQNMIVPPIWNELSNEQQTKYKNAWCETFAQTKDVGKALDAALDSLTGTLEKFDASIETLN